ncbi:MAG: hypothetical protein PHT81_04855 [Endomicrobiaceae bacterium]|nr:hypothetical protein [Endomicrobiaceae bacterium]MDD3922077.1 hypothetical protein [Endomicrobiaceae bacterium]
MANNKNESIYQTLGRVISVVVVAFSIFTIISTIILKDKKNISLDRLRKAYDGLSPQDYQ